VAKFITIDLLFFLEVTGDGRFLCLPESIKFTLGNYRKEKMLVTFKVIELHEKSKKFSIPFYLSERGSNKL